MGCQVHMASISRGKRLHSVNLPNIASHFPCLILCPCRSSRSIVCESTGKEVLLCIRLWSLLCCSYAEHIDSKLLHNDVCNGYLLQYREAKGMPLTGASDNTRLSIENELTVPESTSSDRIKKEKKAKRSTSKNQMANNDSKSWWKVDKSKNHDFTAFVPLLERYD